MQSTRGYSLTNTKNGIKYKLLWYMSVNAQNKYWKLVGCSLKVETVLQSVISILIQNVQ